MKKYFLFLLCIIVSYSSFCQRTINGGSNQSYDELINSEENIWTGDITVLPNEHFANLILSDISYSRYFVPIIESTVKSNKTMFQELYNKGGATLIASYKNFMQSSRTCSELSDYYASNDIDTTLMFDNKAEIFCAWALFMKKCPVFLELSDVRRSEIFSLIMNTLKQDVYRANHPDNILVISYNDALNIMRPINTPDISGRLTQDEVLDCLGGTIVGVVAGANSLIRDFVNVINGTNLGWSGIKAVAKSFFRTLVGSNALGATIGFGICIAWQTFF